MIVAVRIDLTTCFTEATAMCASTVTNDAPVGKTLGNARALTSVFSGRSAYGFGVSVRVFLDLVMLQASKLVGRSVTGLVGGLVGWLATNL